MGRKALGESRSNEPVSLECQRLRMAVQPDEDGVHQFLLACRALAVPGGLAERPRAVEAVGNAEHIAAALGDLEPIHRIYLLRAAGVAKFGAGDEALPQRCPPDPAQSPWRPPRATSSIGTSCHTPSAPACTRTPCRGCEPAAPAFVDRCHGLSAMTVEVSSCHRQCTPPCTGVRHISTLLSDISKMTRSHHLQPCMRKKTMQATGGRHRPLLLKPAV